MPFRGGKWAPGEVGILTLRRGIEKEKSRGGVDGELVKRVNR